MNKLLIIMAIILSNCTIAQTININYPLAGNAIISIKIKDNASKDTSIDVLHVNYYYENNKLNYHIRSNNSEYERIKIKNKQYDIAVKQKEYNLVDTIADLGIGSIFIRNFIDSVYLNSTLNNNKLKETPVIINKKSYNKFSYTEKIDSFNVIGSSEKMAMKSTFKGDYFIDKETGQMQIVNELFTSDFDRYECTQELIYLSSVKQENLKKYINNRLLEITKTYRCTNKDNITTEDFKLDTSISPEVIKSINFYLLNGKDLAFKNINQKYTLIDFWFPSCFPCIKTFPALNKIQTDFGSLIKVIGVNSQKEDVAFMINFCKERKLGYTIALDDDKTINNLFKIYAYPSWLLIDNTGNIIDYSSGYEPDLYQRIKGKIISDKK